MTSKQTGKKVTEFNASAVYKQACVDLESMEEELNVILAKYGKGHQYVGQQTRVTEQQQLVAKLRAKVKPNFGKSVKPKGAAAAASSAPSEGSGE